MNFIPKKSFHFPGGQGHEIYEHEKPGLCWQDFFLTLCPKNYPSRTFIQPQLWHFQSSVGLSHGKIFSDTGVATKEKCGVSRSRVCWRLQKDKQDFGHLNFIQICFVPEPLPMGNQCPKTHHKTSDPKIFISHIPVLNFAGAALHSIPHTCANLEPMSQDTPQNLRPQDFHLTHPCFELCRSRSPYYTPHVCQPLLNQCPKTHHKTSDPKIFISHIPVLNFAGTDLHSIPHTCANLEPMSQDRPQNLRPQDFHLTHPCFALCRSRSPYYTPHVWQPILNQCPKTHHKTSDPKIFISHIPVLNFAGADLHIIPHMCGNPS